MVDPVLLSSQTECLTVGAQVGPSVIVLPQFCLPPGLSLAPFYSCFPGPISFLAARLFFQPNPVNGLQFTSLICLASLSPISLFLCCCLFPSSFWMFCVFSLPSLTSSPGILPKGESLKIFFFYHISSDFLKISVYFSKISFEI